MSRNYLSRNSELRRGDSLLSNNGLFKAIFQDDGNFVIYGWKPVWASDTNGSGAVRLCMQDDSNLVMYNQEDHPRWQTNSHRDGSALCRLQLTDDGKLVIFNHAQQIWCSDSSRGMK